MLHGNPSIVNKQAHPHVSFDRTVDRVDVVLSSTHRLQPWDRTWVLDRHRCQRATRESHPMVPLLSSSSLMMTTTTTSSPVFARSFAHSFMQSVAHFSFLISHSFLSLIDRHDNTQNRMPIKALGLLEFYLYEYRTGRVAL